MQWQHKIKVLIFFYLLIGLNACGFHLSGSALSGMQDSNIYIQSKNAKDLKAAVQRQLQIANLKTVPRLSNADYIVGLNDESYDQRVLAVTETTGKVQHYEITYSATISIASSEHTALISDQKIAISRDYVFNENSILDNSNKTAQLKRDIVRQAAKTLIRQLRTVIR